MPFDNLNRRFIDLKKVAFSACQEAENDFKVTFDNLNHRFFDFIQIAFWAVLEAENEFAVPCNLKKVAFLFHPSRILGWTRSPKWVECHSRPWNIAFSTSTNSHFGMVKRPKMSLKNHATPWNIAFSTSPKSHFGLVKGKKMSYKCQPTTWNIDF